MTKPKQVSVNDNYGSAPHLRAAVREVLWCLVQRIDEDDRNALTKEKEEQEIERIHQLREEMRQFGVDLPVQFLSNPKRKRKKDEAQSKASKVAGSEHAHANLQPPQNKALMIEHNIFKCKTTEVGEPSLVRVVGVAPNNDKAGSKAVVRILCSKQLFHVDRCTELIPITSKNGKKAAKKARIADEAFCLQDGAPTGVHLKYWNQRFRLLSKFDSGVQLDAESWFSITPESIAKYLTVKCFEMARNQGIALKVVLDCFAGCGGNSIPFAVSGAFVVSLDNDSSKLRFLRHNSEIYGVAANIDLIQAEVFNYLTSCLSEQQLYMIESVYNSYGDNSNAAADTTGSCDDTAAAVGSKRKIDQVATDENWENSNRSSDDDGSDSDSSNSSDSDSSNSSDSGSSNSSSVDSKHGITSSCNSNDDGAGQDESNEVHDIEAIGVGATGTGINSSADNGDPKDIPAATVTDHNTLPDETTAAVKLVTDSATQDCKEIPAAAAQLSPDLIVLSPPWGGPGYRDVDIFYVDSMLPCGCGYKMVMLAAAVCPNILLLLPKNACDNQMHEIAQMIKQPYQIEYIRMNKSPKLKAVYFGPMAKKISKNLVRANNANKKQKISNDEHQHIHFE